MPELPAATLARWRRFYGVWHVRFIVEGYDDEYEYVYRGDTSEPFVRAMVVRDAHLEFGHPAHIVSIRKQEV